MIEVIIAYCIVSYLIVLVWLGDDAAKSGTIIKRLWARCGKVGKTIAVLAILLFILLAPIAVWYIVFRKED